jgi:hypothetical protein
MKREPPHSAAFSFVNNGRGGIESGSANVGSWQILLQKSFCTRDQNFFWLYTRFSRKDVGDLIA